MAEFFQGTLPNLEWLWSFECPTIPHFHVDSGFGPSWVPRAQKNPAIFRVGPLDLRIGGSLRQFLSETSRVVPDIFGQTSRTACFLRICERGPSKVRQQIPHIVDPNGEFILFGINQ